MSTPQVQSDHLRYVKWLIIGSAGLFICHYVYKNSNQFFNLTTDNQQEAYKINKRPKDDKSDDDKSDNEQQQQQQETKEEEKKVEQEEKSPSPKKANDSVKFPVQVFVRMRPLVGKEISDNHESIEYNVKTNKKKSTKSLTLEKVFGRNNERDKKYTDLTNVILPTNNNEATFDICLKPALSNIFKGEKTCIFAYGHTGSGKTHTIFVECIFYLFDPLDHRFVIKITLYVF